MRKCMEVMVGILLASFPLTALAADNVSATQSVSVMQGAGQSNVSQAQIENVQKRDEARRQRDKKMKVRAKNVQSPRTKSSNLFRSSE